MGEFQKRTSSINMIPENFSLKCEFDEAEMANEEDYENHLRIVHEMTKSTEDLILRAKEKSKANFEKNVDPAIEEITIDDDDDGDTDGKELNENIRVSESNIQKQMEDAVDFLFKDLKIMIDGILPSINENIEGKEDLKTDFKVPDDISKCFDDLRKVISTIEIPQTLFSSTNVSMTDNIQKSEEQVSVKTPEVPKIQPKPVTPQPGQTLFLCPVDNCDFYTTRAGFENKIAANHLIKDHKVTPADMTPGKYKFKKVKGEKVKSKF